ncbi:uncharacterized protein LODBEIA_P12760 [Lodderomyces beijingensis]|uniref:U3 small nucleolar RNA-associated protein 10 n=1 Tax=Lodderomyces beijingensis TaxID=1775926 RepID=A0ABP0ZLI1_9ASCO
MIYVILKERPVVAAMSSLASQLKSINEKNSSVAFNRQQRSKLHSRSLIFDPKVASGQDYEYIYEIAVAALDELCELDSRFGKFKPSLFSRDSVNFDRNVQTEELINQLNKNIDAFFILLAPYYGFTAALRAAEWLVRRFQANVHNSEYMITTSLPYFSSPVFIKILNVIPKQNIPQIFEWLTTYKDSLKCPTLPTVFRAFYNDQFLFNFYSSFVNDQVQNKTVYKQLLVFHLSIAVQLLAANSKNQAYLNDVLIPTILQTVNIALTDASRNNSNNNNNDDDNEDEEDQDEVKLTAFSLLAVLSSVAPLTFEVLDSLTVSILNSLQPSLLKQTVTLLVQLWGNHNNNNRGTFETAPPSLAKLQPTPDVIQLLRDLHVSHIKKNRFLAAYFGNIFPRAESLELLKLMDLDQTLLFNFITTSVLEQVVNEGVTNSDGEGEATIVAVAVVKRLVKTNEAAFDAILSSLGVKLADLELKLQSSIKENTTVDFDNYVADDDDDDEEADVEVSVEKEADVEKKMFDLEGITAAAPTYFNSNFDKEFYKLASELVKLCSTTKGSHKAAVLHFAHVVFEKQNSSELGFSFLVRIAFTGYIPVVVRLASLKSIATKLKELDNGKTDFYLLLPLLFAGLFDDAKAVRSEIVQVIKLIYEITSKLHKGKKLKTSFFFMDSQIYGSAEKKLISPQDALKLLTFVHEEGRLNDAIFEKLKITWLLDLVFKFKAEGKSLGSLFETFILSQWALPFSIVFKDKIWQISALLNKSENGRAYFWDTDVKEYFKKRSNWVSQASQAKLDFVAVESSLLGLVSGPKSTQESSLRDSNWLCQALDENNSLQVNANARILQVFQFFKSVDSKLQVVNKLIELLVSDSTTSVEFEFDPIATLQQLPLDSPVFLQSLENVQIGDQMPEQGVVKRRRRSSNSTRQAMAKNDVNSLASHRLKKLAILLEILEVYLRQQAAVAAQPKLLKVLFKILIDLDYLGNDGNLPVLYTQELLAACLLLTIAGMKKSGNNFDDIDSNSIRADLIVNSIRSSTSPQVQNKLLLVISELASFAPEIILHSVMPIFTFMGAHTIRQDDEFSSEALQKTVATVIPALAKSASGPISSKIEFLLASFTAAFQHIPSHRRVKLYVALTQTLKPSESMYIVIYLLGQQYVEAKIKRKTTEVAAEIEAFMNSYLRAFTADEQLQGLSKFCDVLKNLPVQALEVNSLEYETLRSRPIFGNALVNSSSQELIKMRVLLLQYLNTILSLDSSKAFDVTSLKSKIAITLAAETDDKKKTVNQVKDIISFALSELDTFTEDSNPIFLAISEELFALLGNALNLLPIEKFLELAVDSLDVNNLRDNTGVKVAKNYAILTARKFENEIGITNESSSSSIEDFKVESLSNVLLKGIEKNIDPEMQQAYLNAFSVVTSKLATLSEATISTKAISSFLVQSLNVITSGFGLLSDQSEIVIASISAIVSIVNVAGIKTLGMFPKIVPPTLKIWELSTTSNESSSTESAKLIQESVLLLLSCYIKKMPAFMVTSLDSVFLTTLRSDLVDNQIKASVLNMIVDRVNVGQALKSLYSIWMYKDFYKTNNPSDLGLYLNTVQSTTDKMDKSEAISQSSLFMKWLIHAFEFRAYCQQQGDNKFDNNAIHRIESSFQACAIAYVMKLNDKSFRPLFANLVRWAAVGEGGSLVEMTSTARLLSFHRFFNKMQESLKSIVTSYYSYLIDLTSENLRKFAESELEETSLRRIMLISLSMSFNFDQDEYWSQQGRFDSICMPLLSQLANIEDSIGKFLVKAITALVADVSSNEYNEAILKGLIKFISYDNKNSSNTKLWTIRTLKSIFQKMGDQWLPYVPTLVPHIAELLEDDDEAVELEVREGLVRVIEKILGEPLDRYLS